MSDAMLTPEQLREVQKELDAYGTKPVFIQPVTDDPVNHPSHYCSHPSGVEAIEIAEHMSYNLGNVVKYLFRAGLKDDAITDLKKAEFYIHREIQRLEKV